METNVFEQAIALNEKIEQCRSTIQVINHMIEYKNENHGYKFVSYFGTFTTDVDLDNELALDMLDLIKAYYNKKLRELESDFKSL